MEGLLASREHVVVWSRHPGRGARAGAVGHGRCAPYAVDSSARRRHTAAHVDRRVPRGRDTRTRATPGTPGQAGAHGHLPLAATAPRLPGSPWVVLRTNLGA